MIYVSRGSEFINATAGNRINPTRVQKVHTIHTIDASIPLHPVHTPLGRINRGVHTHARTYACTQARAKIFSISDFSLSLLPPPTPPLREPTAPNFSFIRYNVARECHLLTRVSAIGSAHMPIYFFPPSSTGSIFRPVRDLHTHTLALSRTV